VKVVTLGEGEVNALHVGLKGMMNALGLQDLAAGTKRGIARRVQAGKCFGPPPRPRRSAPVPGMRGPGTARARVRARSPGLGHCLSSGPTIASPAAR
jgi:hypothetical protein